MPGNVIFVLADQLSRWALGTYGCGDAVTPHLDSMAASGARFERACSTYPICVPYRFTLMTGQYAHTRCVPGIDYRMSPCERTLADEFNEAGYETIYLGKWHLDSSSGRAIEENYRLRPVPRQHQGRWRKWMGFEASGLYFDTHYFLDDDPMPRPLNAYQTDGLFGLGMDYLRGRRDERPFCMAISFETPHCPFSPPPEYAQRWKDRPLKLPPNWFVRIPEVDPECTINAWNLRDDLRDELLHCRRMYHGMIENIDDNVGRLMAFLKQSGLDKNTTVVFTADHGDLLGAHGFAEKQYPQEESVGVPLLVAGPGISAGRRIAAPTCTEDLFPTLLGLAGLRPRDALPGTDLTPAIRGLSSGPAREGVMLEYVAEVRLGYPFYRQQWRAFRSERFKYVTFGPHDGASPWLFYDLQNDPYEMVNLVNDPRWRDEIRRHHLLLSQRIIETGDTRYSLLPAFDCPAVNAVAR